MPRTVLFLHSSAGLYGADLQLLALVEAAGRAICVLPERGELAPRLEEAGAEVIVHPLAVLRRRRPEPMRTAAALVRDRRALAREVDVVHSNTSVVLSGQAVARALGARHVMHVREIYPASRLWPLMRRRLMRADALVCISGAVAAQFPARARVVRDGLPRVPEPPPRAEARAALGLPADAFVVAAIGRVSDWKGQDVFVDALRAVDGAVGLVAGDTAPGHDDAERRLRELSAGAPVRLLGFRHDVDTILGAADAVAVPSLRPEPLGLVALEAGAVGLPVVASGHGGLTEVVRDGETGLLVPPGDASALAGALRRLAGDPGLRERLGSAAAEEVRVNWSRERMLDEMRELYERLG